MEWNGIMLPWGPANIKFNPPYQRLFFIVMQEEDDIITSNTNLEFSMFDRGQV